LEDHVVLVKDFGFGMGVGRFCLEVDTVVMGAWSKSVGVDWGMVAGVHWGMVQGFGHAMFVVAVVVVVGL
jgi:hypothetical protein